MSYLFLDSSALVKRYLKEVGSVWVNTLTDRSTQNTIVVAEITRVEVSAALAARQRASDGISLAERDRLLQLLLHHFDTEYDIGSLTSSIISSAVILTQRYRLRAYDAVQLATVLDIHHIARTAGLSSITFIAADDDLLIAARSEGLAVDNPKAHP